MLPFQLLFEQMVKKESSLQAMNLQKVCITDYHFAIHITSFHLSFHLLHYTTS